MKIILLCVIICAVFAENVQAQTSTISRTYSFLPFKTAIFNSIVVTDSCYYISGIVSDSVWPYNAGALFVKTDLNGNPLIVKGLTDKVEKYETWFQSLSSDSEGNLATHGYNYAQDINTLFFIKYDTDGNVLDLSEFHSNITSTQEIPYDMVRFVQDHYMVCVSVAHPGGYSDLQVIKLDQHGIPEFSKLAASNVNTSALNRITTTQDGGFIVGGVGSNQNVVSSNIIMQTVLTKLDSLGNKEWDYLSPINEDWLGTLGGVVVNDNQEIVFATAKGKAIPINSSSEYFVWDWCIIKMDINKNILWKTFFRPSPNAFQDIDQHLWNTIALRNQKGYVAVGQSFEPGPAWQGWMVKVAENGDSLWMRSYNFDGINVAYELKDIKEDLEGNLVMVGEYRDMSSGDGGQKAWLLKVDQYGCLVPGCHVVATEDVDSNEVNLLLYPNPVDDFLSFYCSFSPLLKEITYFIMDNQGRLLVSPVSISSNGTHIFSVKSLPAGSYFLHLAYNNHILKSGKFVVGH